MCIFVDFTAKNYVKALGKKYQNKQTKKKLLPIFYNKKYDKTSSFISPFKHVVSRVPREHRQMNNEGTTSWLIIFCLKEPRGIVVEPSGPVCSAAALKQFSLT